MPLDLTAVFSTLIILAGLMGTTDYGVRRMLWNVCGLVIGCVLTCLLPSVTKLSKVRQSLMGLSRVWLEELERLLESGKWEFSPAYAGRMAESTVEMASIQAYVAIVDKDVAKAAPFPLSLLPNGLFSARYRRHAGTLEEIHGLMAATGALLALARHISARGGALGGLTEERQAQYRAHIRRISADYAAALNAGTAAPCRAEAILTAPEDEEELLLLDAVLTYASGVGKCRPAPDRLSAAAG